MVEEKKSAKKYKKKTNAAYCISGILYKKKTEV